MIEIKCIGLTDKVPKGWKYLSSWDCEKLLCENFDVFKDLETSLNVGYYKLINKNNNRYLWLHRLGSDSDIDGDNRNLNYNNRVRGVLIHRGK